MALLFNGNNDEIDHGAFACPSDGTYAGWLRLNASTGRHMWFFQEGAPDCQFSHDGDAATPNLTGFRAGSTYVVANAPLANLSSWGIDKWLFVVFTWVGSGGASTDQKVFCGDLTTLATEPSSYTTQQAGVSPDTSSVTLRIGNQSAGNRYHEGEIAWFAYWNRQLSDIEIHQAQFGRVPRNGLLVESHYWNTTELRDRSGNGRDGTPNGITTAAHPPILAPDLWLPEGMDDLVVAAGVTTRRYGLPVMGVG
jgi:hypothetical protein